jgi:hypothetical protein
MMKFKEFLKNISLVYSAPPAFISDVILGDFYVGFTLLLKCVQSMSPVLPSKMGTNDIKLPLFSKTHWKDPVHTGILRGRADKQGDMPPTCFTGIPKISGNIMKRSL